MTRKIQNHAIRSDYSLLSKLSEPDGHGDPYVEIARRAVYEGKPAREDIQHYTVFDAGFSENPRYAGEQTGSFPDSAL